MAFSAKEGRNTKPVVKVCIVHFQTYGTCEDVFCFMANQPPPIACPLRNKGLIWPYPGGVYVKGGGLVDQS